ncbi:hypothetical protein D3C80_2112470 [compost metagenome]
MANGPVPIGFLKNSSSVTPPKSAGIMPFEKLDSSEMNGVYGSWSLITSVLSSCAVTLSTLAAIARGPPTFR